MKMTGAEQRYRIAVRRFRKDRRFGARVHLRFMCNSGEALCEVSAKGRWQGKKLTTNNRAEVTCKNCLKEMGL